MSASGNKGAVRYRTGTAPWRGAFRPAYTAMLKLPDAGDRKLSNVEAMARA